MRGRSARRFAVLAGGAFLIGVFGFRWFDAGSSAHSRPWTPVGSPVRSPQRVISDDQPVFRLLAQRSGGTPAAGLEVQVNGISERTNEAGAAQFTGLPEGKLSLALPANWRADVGEVTVGSTNSSASVMVTELCDVSVRVENQGGSPVGGAVVSISSGPVRSGGATDSAGIALLSAAPCWEWARVGVLSPAGTERVTDRLVDPVETIVVRLFAPRSATLFLVDAAGESVVAALRLVHGPPATEVEPGEYLLTAEAAAVDVVVERAGHPTQRATVPLDGGVHELLVGQGRTVGVFARCKGEGCHTAIECDNNACSKLLSPPGEARYTCECADSERGSYLAVVGTSPRPVEVVPPDVSEVELDFLGEGATVVGRFVGPLPCRVAVYVPMREAVWANCDQDGSFLVTGATAGLNMVDVSGGEGAEAMRRVELAAGQTTDLGEVSPSLTLVQGRVEADFSLEGASVYVDPYVGGLGAGGVVDVRVPAEGDVVDLRLVSPEFGIFWTSVAARPGFVWRVQWAADRDPWVDVPDSDTGAP